LIFGAIAGLAETKQQSMQNNTSEFFIKNILKPNQG